MKFPEQFRWRCPGSPYDTKPGSRFGVFSVPDYHACGRNLKIVVDDGELTGWQHVSVSIWESTKTPSWNEMCLVKSLFWDDEELAVQYHPPKSQYINTHPGTLHLWRPIRQPMPMPPKACV